MNSNENRPVGQNTPGKQTDPLKKEEFTKKETDPNNPKASEPKTDEEKSGRDAGSQTKDAGSQTKREETSGGTTDQTNKGSRSTETGLNQGTVQNADAGRPVNSETTNQGNPLPGSVEGTTEEEDEDLHQKSSSTR